MRMKKYFITLAFSVLFSNIIIAADYEKALKSGDYKTALLELVPLANQGNAAAQFSLGVMYARGDGVLKNDKTSIQWYTSAAKQGYVLAQYNLGLIYEFGNGIPKDYETAIRSD